MSSVRIAGALLERLGEPASAALDDVLDARDLAVTEFVMAQSAERFERRLVEVKSELRVEISQLRCEMREGFASIRAEMAAGRFELLKWAFVFWVGQLVGVVGLVGLLLRNISGR